MRRIRSSSQDHAIVPPSALQSAIVQTTPLPRASDRLSIFHTTCRKHRRVVLQDPCFVSMCSVRDFLLSGLPCSPPSDSWRSCMRFAVLGIHHHCFNSFSTLTGMRSTTSQPRHCRVLPCLSRKFLSRYVRRDLTFVQSSVGRASTNLAPGTGRDRHVGIPRITTANHQECFVPGIAARQPSHHSPHQCSTCGVNRVNSSVFPFFQKALLDSIEDPALSRLHRGF